MTKLKLPGPIVSTQWLASHLGHPKLVVLDASLQPMNTINVNLENNKQWQIPGTRVFDFDKKICDQKNTLPHMMPTPELFVKEVRALGICTDSIIVVFDRFGVYSSPRAWWMFKSMGHKQIAVLDGGMPAWLEAKMPCEPCSSSENLQILSGDFVAQPDLNLFCNAEQVLKALTDKQFIVIDARSKERYLGLEHEPRLGLRSGHMPNALNLPYPTLLSGYNMRTVEELTMIFASIANHQQKLIFTCGSGVTSCILALAADLVGYTQISVYDGSWSEWGASSSLPVIVD